MPTTYAHYRFGCQALAVFPEPVRQAAARYRGLFDFGVHGPDLLFYDKPFVKTEVNQLGCRCHRRTGRDFFTQGAKTVRACRNREAAVSYLFGVLCHFALDRECHPYVGYKEKTGVSHSAIEASFDRYLMELDGLDPLRHKPTGHLKPSRLGALTIAEFYPPLTPEDVFKAEKSMVFYLNALAVPPGTRRSILEKGMKLAGRQSMADLLIPLTPNPACRDSDNRLLSHTQDALTLVKAMAPELLGLIGDESPLGMGFDHTFEET